MVIPEARCEGNGYVLGHYAVERLGKLIVLYYGSFGGTMVHARALHGSERSRPQYAMSFAIA